MTDLSRKKKCTVRYRYVFGSVTKLNFKFYLGQVEIFNVVGTRTVELPVLVILKYLKLS